LSGTTEEEKEQEERDEEDEEGSEDKSVSEEDIELSQAFLHFRGLPLSIFTTFAIGTNTGKINSARAMIVNRMIVYFSSQHLIFA
jgi:hypothetical protein